MNHSFLYHATKSNNEMALQKDEEVNCETACSDEVFDLPQVRVRTIVHKFQEQITSIWEVQHVHYPLSPHFVFLLTNGDYKCTCIIYMISGWVCRHFFRIITITPLARFHISMINQHWYKDQVYYDNNIINRLFIKLRICNDIENNFPIRWTPIQSADTLGFQMREWS